MMTKDFIYIISKPAVQAWEDHHMSAAVTIQQGVIESASGEHTCHDIYSGQDGNNLFGLTWDEKYTADYPYNFCNTKEWNPEKKIYENKVRKFIRFKDWDESIDYHTLLMLKARYKKVIESNNWWEATKAIKDAGYATSPTYTDTLRFGIIKQELYKYDWIDSPHMKLTPNFKWGEFFSTVRFKGKDYKRVIEPTPEQKTNVEKLARNLQIISDINGNKPIAVSSGVRISEYNSLLPTAALDSKHLYGLAVDIIPMFDVSLDKLFHDAKENTEFRGFIIYNGWLHLDFRNKIYIEDKRRK
jgi:hypothetical protein